MVTDITTKEFKEYLKKRIIEVYVYYGISDLVNKEILKKEANQNGLNVEFLKGELEGIVQVSLMTLPLKLDSLDMFEKILRLKFKEPLTKALRESDNSSEISSFLRKTNYLKHFCELALMINNRIKKGKEDIASLKNYLMRYEKFLGQEGIKIFIEIFKQSKEEKIIETYSNYQDFILKKFQIEVFISQQVNHNYLTILRLNPKLLVEDRKDNFKVDLIGLKHFNFEKINWHHDFLEQRTEMYKCKENKNIILIPMLDYKNKANESLLWLRLLFQNINSGLHLMKHVLDQEDEILEEELENFPVHLESIKNNIQIMNSDNLKETQELIVAYQNTLTSSITDLYTPIKNEFKKYLFKKDRMNKLIEDKTLRQPLIDGKGLVYGVKKLRLPTDFGISLPSEVISSIYSSISTKEKKINELQKALRDINKEIGDLEHIKQINEMEVNEAKQRERAAKEIRIRDHIMKGIEFIINILKVEK